MHFCVLFYFFIWQQQEEGAFEEKAKGSKAASQAAEQAQKMLKYSLFWTTFLMMWTPQLFWVSTCMYAAT